MRGWLTIENGTVLPMTQRDIIANGHVLIKDDGIVAVGPGPAPEREGLARLDARGGLILPGLVDAHAHAGHGLTKGLGSASGEWMTIAGRIYARATDAAFWHAEARLSALERLLCGTTTAALLMGGGPDIMRTETPEAAEAHLDGVRSVGVAEVLAVGPNRPDGPAHYLSWNRAESREIPVSPREQLTVARKLIQAHNGDGGSTLQIALSLPVFSGTDLAIAGEDAPAALSRAALRLAEETGALLVQDGHRDGSMAAAAATVGLGPRHAVFAHSIDLTEADRAALRASGAAIAHNPSALMSVFGRCPAPELAAEGITVAIGSDAPAPDRPFDLFRCMFHMHRYHATHFHDDAVLPPWQVLEMATIEGAKALNLADQIGSLEPGKRADIIVVDWAKPHLWPPVEPVQRLTRFANGADVASVVVAGRVLMQDRRVQSVDAAAVLREAAGAYATMVARAGLADRFPLLSEGLPQ